MKNLVLSCVVLLAFIAPAFADSGVSVTGTGVVNVTPDQASVTLSVVTENEFAAKAHVANITETNKLFKLLSDHNFDKSKDFQTSHYGIARTYSQTNQPAGYRATHNVSICCRHLSKIEKLLDAISKDSDSSILFGNISFDTSKRAELINQARDLATADAKRKAEQLAKGAGASLGNVVNIIEQENFNRVGYDVGHLTLESPGRHAQQIAPGQRTISVTVHTTWTLVPVK